MIRRITRPCTRARPARRTRIIAEDRPQDPPNGPDDTIRAVILDFEGVLTGADGTPVLDDAADMIRGLKAAGIAVGIVSDDDRTTKALNDADLTSLVDAVSDETGSAALPDRLHEIARHLGSMPGETALVGATPRTVGAGSAARLGLVIGADRHDDSGQHRHALRSGGADLVTRDLRQLLLPDGGLRTLDRLPLIWDRLDAVRARIGARPVATFLDFDGTLSPIVADFRAASIPDETRDAVARLAGCCPVAVISGRDLQDVRARVGLEDVIYAGSHGFDIAGPDGLEARPDEAEGFLQPIADADAALHEALSGVEGADVERKTFSVAVHYRRVAEQDVPTIENAVDRIVADRKMLRKGRGKMVFEIQPRADWDKGRAVAWLLENTRLGTDDALPVYFGDDLTDEDAFGALSGSGLCIAVRGGGRATLADYALADTDDVRRFVLWLADRGAPSR
ncbi:trehalose-phosphatase [Citreimonas sp.]|uniref:trehalose-phosphatase n=1 Tax=Citreimonas sp. TaxID=3036715 RepID=UPI0035C7984E